jgi:ribosomal subunit interface protein
MQIPVTISAPHLELAPNVESLIREKASKLERFYPRITSCRVAVEESVGRRKNGGPYEVRLDLTVPGSELVSRRENEDMMTAIREAFEAARRQLEDYARVQRRDVKRHSMPAADLVSGEVPSEEGEAAEE